MQLDKKLLSDFNVYTKYAKYIPAEKRRESWEEVCYRNLAMHTEKFKYLGKDFAQEIYDVYMDFVIPKKVLPSMRSMQFAGKPIELSPNRIYNCAYMPINAIECFSEAMFLLLGGTGVGYSVQYHHIEQLPEIIQPNPERKRRILVNDSIEGWADAVKILFETYTGKRTSTPVFDYRDIRPKGALLKTSGGRAPGPAPLRECIVKIENMLMEKKNGSQLTSLEVHDMLCYIADAVLAGGIRRAALISLFSADDMDMITCKSGEFWRDNPQRSRANNSAVLVRSKLKKDYFFDLWDRIVQSGSGEPGIYHSHDKDWGTNPCCEIALRPYQFCNLTECNVSDVESQEDLEERVKAATFLGTLQAAYTDFHYLREVWKRTTERDSLLGVSMTGIASNRVSELDIEHAAYVAKEENKRVADIIGVRQSARITCIKPSGTASCVLGTSSGIHAWYAPFYIRRVRMNKTEPIYAYLKETVPDLVEDDTLKSTDAVLSIPQKAPSGNIITRHETALEMLERVKDFSLRWVKQGHNRGINGHNVSATISVREDEWDRAGEWMWKNRHYYNGLAVLPYSGGTYTQAPFEECDEETYNRMFQLLADVNFTEVVEENDNTDFSGEIACAGGACEI